MGGRVEDNYALRADFIALVGGAGGHARNPFGIGVEIADMGSDLIRAQIYIDRLNGLLPRRPVREGRRGDQAKQQRGKRPKPRFHRRFPALLLRRCGARYCIAARARHCGARMCDRLTLGEGFLYDEFAGLAVTAFAKAFSEQDCFQIGEHRGAAAEHEAINGGRKRRQADVVE